MQASTANNGRKPRRSTHGRTVIVPLRTPGRIKARQGRFRNLSEIDLRTRSGKRAVQLMALFEDYLGGVESEGARMAVHRAATLTALSEDRRMRALRGDLGVVLDDLVRVDRLAAQSVRALDHHRKRKPPVASALDELLPQRGDDDDE
jgi:hypothetical protein